MYEELMFHLFITCEESMDKVHEAYRKVWIKFKLFEERIEGSEQKIDNLRQLLLDVSDIFIEFYILFNQIMYFISIFLLSYCMMHILF